ncbi:MAG: pantoate kinase [Candidatus Hodarchaeota archaeon]
MTAKAFVPGHVTCIFRIHDEHENPLWRGSRGAGFGVLAGTKTTVSIESSSSTEINVNYNDEPIDASVTETVVHRLLEEQEQNFKVTVHHQSELPIGVGFGASGAGALGTAISLAHLLTPDSDPTTTAAHAHYAEVVNHTGLGDVIAQTYGGIEVRLHPGAPGIGKIVNITPPHNLHVVLAGAPGLETKKVLTDPEHRSRINQAGDELLFGLTSNPNLENLIDCSKRFAESIGLMTPRVESALNDLRDAGLENSSMVMLGDSVFTLCQENQISPATEILANHWDDSQVMVTSISTKGGRLIE